MPTSPRGRSRERERWPERHPTLTRAINGAGALLCGALAAVTYVGERPTLAVGLGVLALVLLVGVVWPKFSAAEVVFGAWYWR